MQVQPIQSTANNRRKSNCSFNASFIDDKNGYFRKLWQDAHVDSSFHDAVDRFYNSHVGHLLEITKVSKNETEFTIFNHRNGYEKICELKTGVLTKLEELIEKILDSKHLFTENSKSAESYQKLTGQKVDVG